MVAEQWLTGAHQDRGLAVSKGYRDTATMLSMSTRILLKEPRSRVASQQGSYRKIIPMFLGGASEVLDVGRARAGPADVTPAQRRALDEMVLLCDNIVTSHP
jgi:hypothetical protein